MLKHIGYPVIIALVIIICSTSTSFVCGQPEFPAQVCLCNLHKEGGRTYLPYERINPFYVRFDGFGDGNLLYAILVREPIKSKVILLIVSPKDCKKWIVRNEGKESYVGVDDFSWCKSIDVFPKKSVNQTLSFGEKKIQAVGEGIYLSPGETEGFIVYWNGTAWALSATDAD